MIDQQLPVLDAVILHKFQGRMVLCVDALHCMTMVSYSTVLGSQRYNTSALLMFYPSLV